MDADVIVAGGGPVGLFLAGELALAGVDVLVLERDESPHTPLEQGAMGARALNQAGVEALDRRGLLEAVQAAALWWLDPAAPLPASVGHFAGLPLRTDRLDPAAPMFRLPSAGGGVIAVADLEVVLAGRVGDRLRRGVAVTGLAQDDTGVTVETTAGPMRARWLVGCDGGRSAVRKAAGIPFPGAPAELVGRQAMVRFAHPEPLTDWVETAGGAYAHGPVPGRIHTVEHAPAPEHVDLADLEASLARVTGRAIALTHVEVATSYTDQARQAATYRSGRVLLAGDAAHVHSPAGGQGLNLGLGDAMNLGWRLAEVLHGAPDALLDAYTAERHPAGAWVQAWTMAQSALTRPDPRSRALKQVMAQLIDLPQVATSMLEQLTGFGRRYDLPGSHPLVGLSAPDLRFADGSRLAEHCRAGGWLWVDLGSPATPPAGVRVLRGHSDTVPGLRHLLVRPDGVVADAL